MMNENADLKWLKRAAWMSGVLALTGSLLISLGVTFAADQKGSEPEFSNPFVLPDGADNAPPQIQVSKPGRATRVLSAGGKTSNDEVPDPVFNDSGIEVGGGLPAGVIPGSKVPFVSIDSESAITNSKEIVTDFNFPNAEIVDIAKTMGKLTGKNFILDRNVKGQVTIISNSSITVGDAWRAFLTALDVNDLTIVPSGGYLRITNQRFARDKQISVYTDKPAPDTDALVTRVFTFKYIAATEIDRVFRVFISSNSRIVPHEQTNTLIVTDTGANIKKLEKMAKFLDVEGFDAGIEVIRVKYASAVDLADLIDTLLPGQATSSTLRNTRTRRTSSRTSSFSARKTKEGGFINTIIADERTNSMIVNANAKGVEQVRELVAQLDRKVPPNQAGGKVHVLYLQYADAEEVSKTLSSLTSSTGSSSRTSTKGGIGTNPTTTSLFEGAIKVASDKATNSLVITASPSDFETMKNVIAKLDIARDEVFVEAIIMEMNISKNFNMATGLAAPIPNPNNTSGNNYGGLATLTSSSDLFSFLASPAALSGMALGFAQGKTFTVPFNGTNVTVGSINGLISAIQGRNNTNILATPQILTMDNQEATFTSGESIPLPTTTIASTGSSTQSSITYRDVQLSLKIKPQINKASNFVKLDIDAQLEDISDRTVPTAVATQAQAILKRTAKTTVTVADEDTVVLGGLIRDKVTKGGSKIPVLGDIPLLGWLFRQTKDEISKSNLMIFLTPHIIRKYEKMRKVLDRKLKERDDFIERNSGGEDPLQYKRDAIIRELPSVEEIESRSKPNSALLLNTEPSDPDEAVPLIEDEDSSFGEEVP